MACTIPVLDVVGIASGDYGCRCEVNENNTLPTKCCGSVLDEDVVVRLQCNRILVKDFAKGKMREEMIVSVYWVTGDVDHCHVGFLPCNCVQQASVYDGAYFQVLEPC